MENMTLKFWTDLGFTEEEAINLVVEAEKEYEYENQAHRNFYNNNL